MSRKKVQKFNRRKSRYDRLVMMGLSRVMDRGWTCLVCPHPEWPRYYLGGWASAWKHIRGEEHRENVIMGRLAK